MILQTDSIKEFRKKLELLSREELLEIIQDQDSDPEYGYMMQINRIEYVFRRNLSHLTWDDGSPITERPLTKEELMTLIDPPFIYDKELAKLGFSEAQQKQIHIASDPVLWAKNFLGAEPRVYQTLVLREPHHRRVMRFGRRMGKRLDVSTPIPTPNGWTTMGNLQVGDQVFDENGKACNVTFISEVLYDRPTYKVIFSDGSELIADRDHQWSVETKTIRKNNARNKKKKLSPVVKTTGQMLKDLRVGSKNEANYSIVVAKPLEYTKEDVDLPIDPYILGCWLGDGTAMAGQMTIADQDYEEFSSNFANSGYSLTIQKNKYSYGIKGLRTKLIDLGLLDNKHIPDIYKTASVEQRFELLRGLMDTDGSCDENGWCEISSSDPNLAEEILDLTLQLGIKSTKQISESWLNGVRHKDRTRIHFKTNYEVFRLFRKLDKQVNNSSINERRYIVDIQPIECVPMKCISVDSPNSLYLAGRECIPTHNTFTLAMLVLWYAYTNQNMRVIIVAPMKSQVGLIYESVMDLADKNDVVRSSIKRNVTSPQYEIEFSNGSTIRFFTTGMKSNGKADVTRGQEADIIILDEMDYMGPDDLVALLAMLQKTSKEKRVKKLMVAASTPTGQRNTFWSWCTNPEDNFKAFWFPAMANPFWDKETEAQMRRDYPREVDWCHEVEAGWGEDAEGVYPHRFVKPAFIDFSSPFNLNSRGEPVKFQYEPMVYSNNSFFVFGVDWDKYAAGVNIVVLEVCNERYEDERFAGKIRLFYREEVRKDEYTYTASVERIKELNSVFRPQHIYVDRGAGETQIELLHQYGMDHPNTRLHKIVKGYQFGESIDVMDPFTKNQVRKELKVFMVDNLSRLLEQNQILFSDHDEELFMQLLSYIVTRRSSVSGRPIFGPGGNTQDHAHDALLLAAFAIAENYDELLNPRFASRAISVSNDAFLPLISVNTEEEKEIARDLWGSERNGPVYTRRAFSYNRKRGQIKRKMF